MSYNVKDLNKNKPGETAENSSRPSPQAGLYQHPEAKNPDGTPVEAITMYDPLFGDAQSEAFVRLGFVRVGDAPEGAIKTIIEQNMNDRAYNSNVESLSGVNSRVDALELAELRRYKAEREEAERQERKKAEVKAAEEAEAEVEKKAKEAAAKKLEADKNKKDEGNK